MARTSGEARLSLSQWMIDGQGFVCKNKICHAHAVLRNGSTHKMDCFGTSFFDLNAADDQFVSSQHCLVPGQINERPPGYQHLDASNTPTAKSHRTTCLKSNSTYFDCFHSKGLTFKVLSGSKLAGSCCRACLSRVMSD